MAALEIFCFVWGLVVVATIGFLMKYAQKKKDRMLESLKHRPSVKYLRKRLLVRNVFKEKFPEIKRLAKKLHFKEESVKEKPFLSKPKFNPIELPNGGIRSAISSILGESLGSTTEDMLMEKISSLYDLLVENDTELDQSLMHKALRFEIKNNCMKNPYDIFGSKFCKIIESAFQDIADLQKKPTLFQEWSRRVYDMKIAQWISLTFDQCISLTTEYKKMWLTIRIIIVVATFVLIVTCGVVYELYMEICLMAFLVLINFGIILFVKVFSFYEKFTLSSIVLCISQVIFITVGLYMYDYASDIQVFLKYSSTTDRNASVDLNSIPQYSIIGYIKNTTGDSETMEISEIHMPVVFLKMLLILTAIITIPSLTCIKNQMDVTFVMNGKVKEAPLQGDYRKRLFTVGANHKEETSELLWRIIKRHELTISEAGVESTYQFMVQWAIYFTMNYWFSLADKTRDTFTNNEFFIDVRDNLRFGFLWRSGFISLLSLSYAQIKLNDVQHELSLDAKQRFMYSLASISNTISYAALLVLLATNVFDTVPLIRDYYLQNDPDGDLDGFLLLEGTSKVELITLYLITMFPLLTRTAKAIMEKMCCMKKVVTQRNADILFESRPNPMSKTVKGCLASLLQRIMTYLNGLTGVFHFQFLQLPTSQSFQYRNIYYFHAVSYNCRESIPLLTSFINQCFLSIVILASSIVIGAFNLYYINSHLFSLHNDDGLGMYSTNSTYLGDISPSAISTARYNFLIICCIAGPFGFLLGYLFLYLYFKLDKGFFTATTLQFQFAQDRFGGTSKVTGTWIDLNGQNDYFHKQDILDETAQEAYYNLSLGLGNIERDVFEDIKDSFPFYQKKKLQDIATCQDSDQCCGKPSFIPLVRWKIFIRILLLSILHFWLINHLLKYKKD